MPELKNSHAFIKEVPNPNSNRSSSSNLHENVIKSRVQPTDTYFQRAWTSEVLNYKMLQYVLDLYRE